MTSEAKLKKEIKEMLKKVPPDGQLFNYEDFEIRKLSDGYYEITDPDTLGREDDYDEEETDYFREDQTTVKPKSVVERILFNFYKKYLPKK